MVGQVWLNWPFCFCISASLTFVLLNRAGFEDCQRVLCAVGGTFYGERTGSCHGDRNLVGSAEESE